MVATSFSNRPVHNPYAHPTALTVARAMAPADSYINSNRPPQNMACRSQLRNGSTKTCRRRGGRTKFSYGSRQQRALDGSRPFSQYRDCKICKVKQYNADKSESQKKKIPHRGHHPICPDKPRPVQSPMTEFVQRTFAANIRLNIAPIERVSMPSNQVQNSHVPNPFLFLALAQGKQRHLRRLSQIQGHHESMQWIYSRIRLTSLPIRRVYAENLTKECSYFKRVKNSNFYRTRGIQLLLD